MTYRIRNIGIAVALAIVAALLTTFYVTNYKRTVQHGEQRVPVYVASHDIALGTSGSAVAHGNALRVEHVARRSVVPGAISQPNQIDSLVAVEPIYAGEQISTRRFRTAEERGRPAQGQPASGPGSGNPVAAPRWHAQEGDRVDVVGTWLMPETSRGTSAESSFVTSSSSRLQTRPRPRARSGRTRTSPSTRSSR